jgi:hypothetical protein
VHLLHRLGVGEALHDLPLVLLCAVVGHPLRQAARPRASAPTPDGNDDRPAGGAAAASRACGSKLVPSRERERE